MNRREFLGRASVAGMSMSLPPDVLASDLPADVTELDASSLSSAIRQRHVSCVEVMRAYLQRIDRYNPVYNALVSLAGDDDLLKQAELADKALDDDDYWGWMHGMPYAVKDMVDVEGMPTSWGSPILAGRIAARDQLMVARIRRQGAIFIGKTNMPEFGFGSQTYNPVFGTTGNAYDPALTAGGSSGGAACGLATHMLPVADGSDHMGSLRNPGAFNNVIGFRPTQERVPNDVGQDLFYMQMGAFGPMGRNTADTIRLLHTIAGPDPRRPLSLRDRLPAPEEFRPLDPRGLRIGWMGDLGGHLAMEPGVIDVCEASLATLADAGVIVESCLPDYDLDRLWETWLTLRTWRRTGMQPYYNDAATRKLLKPEVAWEIEVSFDTSAADVYHAGIARADWFREMQRLFGEYDLLMLPSAQVFPFDKNVHWPREINGVEMDTYHRWMEVVIGGTLAGIPVCNVPAGFDPSGRPMGMQVMGPFGADKLVLEFASACESLTGHLARRPALVAAVA